MTTTKTAKLSKSDIDTIVARIVQETGIDHPSARIAYEKTGYSYSSTLKLVAEWMEERSAVGQEERYYAERQSVLQLRYEMIILPAMNRYVFGDNRLTLNPMNNPADFYYLVSRLTDRNFNISFSIKEILGDVYKESHLWTGSGSVDIREIGDNEREALTLAFERMTDTAYWREGGW